MTKIYLSAMKLSWLDSQRESEDENIKEEVISAKLHFQLIYLGGNVKNNATWANIVLKYIRMHLAQYHMFACGGQKEVGKLTQHKSKGYALHRGK